MGDNKTRPKSIPASSFYSSPSPSLPTRHQNGHASMSNGHSCGSNGSSKTKLSDENENPSKRSRQGRNKAVASMNGIQEEDSETEDFYSIISNRDKISENEKRKSSKPSGLNNRGKFASGAQKVRGGQHVGSRFQTKLSVNEIDTPPSSGKSSHRKSNGQSNGQSNGHHNKYNHSSYNSQRDYHNHNRSYDRNVSNVRTRLSYEDVDDDSMRSNGYHDDNELNNSNDNKREDIRKYFKKEDPKNITTTSSSTATSDSMLAIDTSRSLSTSSFPPISPIEIDSFENTSKTMSPEKSLSTSMMPLGDISGNNYNSLIIDENEEEMPPLEQTGSNSLQQLSTQVSQLASPHTDFTDTLNGIAYEPTTSQLLYETLHPEEPVPLINLTNTCYMNSIVQSIFAFPFFLTEVQKKLDLISDKEREFYMTNALLDLASDYKNIKRIEDKSLNLEFLTEALSSALRSLKDRAGDKIEHFKQFHQEDAAEFFETIIGSIQEEFVAAKTSPIDNPINRNFDIELSKYLTCAECHVKAKIENENSHTIHLSIPSVATNDNEYDLQSAIDEYFNEEDREANCSEEGCEGKKKIASTEIVKLPKILFMQLGRYGENGFKRAERVVVPYEVIIPSSRQDNDVMVAGDSLAIVPSPVPTPFRPKTPTITSPIVCVNSAVKRSLFADNLDTISEDNNTPNKPVISNGKYGEINDDDDLQLHDENEKENEVIGDVNLENGTNNGLNNGLDEFDSIASDSLNTLFHTPLKYPIHSSNVKHVKQGEKYRLVSVVCHHGLTRLSGHYVCYINNTKLNQWFKCDDERITKIDWNDVQSDCKEICYCFFYMHSNI